MDLMDLRAHRTLSAKPFAAMDAVKITGAAKPFANLGAAATLADVAKPFAAMDAVKIAGAAKPFANLGAAATLADVAKPFANLGTPAVDAIPTGADAERIATDVVRWFDRLPRSETRRIVTEAGGCLIALGALIVAYESFGVGGATIPLLWVMYYLVGLINAVVDRAQQ